MRTGVGVSESYDTVEAFAEACAAARRGLNGPADLCVVFASGPHLPRAEQICAMVNEELEPRYLIGCGAGGVIGAGREIEEGPGAVVWAASAPGARLATHHLEAEHGPDAPAPDVPVDDLGDCLLLLTDPYSYPADALLAELNESHPGLPVLGGLASAAIGGRSVLFCGTEVHTDGAVACSIAGVPILPCVSQGAAPVGPEMTITAAEENVIAELASRPATEKLGAVISGLGPGERELARGGVMLGIVIDENRPEYERGDFLVRPIIGADQETGTIALGERVAVGQTVRLHVRDAGSADEDLREALAMQTEALGSAPAAGALLFSCNGRGSHMFAVPDHDAGTVEDALGVPAGGFFCAGEIGPVGGRNFLHGFTATMAVFAAD